MVHPYNPAAAAAAKSLQSCLTLCDPIDYSLPGSPIHGILQPTRLLRPWDFPGKSTRVGCHCLLNLLLLLLSCFSCVRLCATQWTAAHQAPLSLGFSRQEHWSGLPFPSEK